MNTNAPILFKFLRMIKFYTNVTNHNSFVPCNQHSRIDNISTSSIYLNILNQEIYRRN